MSIGQRLKQFYESKNYTQKTFSDSVNLSKTTLNNIVLGVSKPSFPIIEAIAKHHQDLDLNWLILGTENKESKLFEANETPPQYEPQKKAVLEGDLNEKRYELLLIEIEALRKRLEMVEREVKKKK